MQRNTGKPSLDNSKQVTDLGLTPPLYEDRATTQDKDNNFYASMLLAPEKEMDVIELYKSINDEIVTYGYSDLITEAKTKWKEEQDEDAALYLTGVIENPDINISEKKKELLKYTRRSTSSSLKEKYIKNLNSSYIIDNGLDTNDSYISADEEIDQLQWEQAFETIATEQKKVINKEVLTRADIDETKAIEVIKRVTTGLKDPGYIPLIDDIAFLGSMIVHLPDYFWELVDTWAAVAGYDTPNILNTKDFGSDANAAKEETVTKMRELVQENRKTAYTHQVSEGLDSVLRVVGIDVDKFSVVGKAFEYLAEAIAWVSKKSTPDDPGKTSLIIESLILIFAPRGVRAAKRKIKGAFGKNTPEYLEIEPNAPFTTEKIKAKLKEEEVFTDKEFEEAEGRGPEYKKTIHGHSTEVMFDGIAATTMAAKVAKDIKSPDANRASVDTEAAIRQNIGEAAATEYRRLFDIAEQQKIEAHIERQKLEAPEQSNPKVDAPFASTNRTNPEAGTKLQEAIIREPTIGEQIGFNVDQMALMFMDAPGNVYKHGNVGQTLDFSHLRAMRNEALKEKRLLLLEPADPNFPAKKAYLEDLYDTTKEILEGQSLVLASSFNKLVPVGDGFDFGVAFKKSSSLDFIDPKEVMAAYTALKERLLIEKGLGKEHLNSSKAFPPIEHYNWQDFFPGERLEIHEIARRDGSLSPLEIYRNGDIPIERLNLYEYGPTNTSFVIRWSQETSFTDLYRPELIRETESARHSGESWIEDVIGDAVPRFFNPILRGSSLSGEGTGGLPGATSRLIDPFGRQAKITEEFIRSQGLKMDAFGNQPRAILDKYLLKKLSSKEQKQLKAILGKLQIQKKDFLHSVTEVLEMLPAGTSLKSALRIQEAQNVFRQFLINDHRNENILQYNDLRLNGYKDQFRWTNPITEIESVIPIMKNFKIEPREHHGKKDLIDVTNMIIPKEWENYPFTEKVWDLNTNLAQPAYYNLRHQLETGEVWRFDPYTNIPIDRVYRVPYKFESILDPNIKFDYVINSRNKPTVLDQNVMPYVAGILPRINKDAYVVFRIPKKVEVNGEIFDKTDPTEWFLNEKEIPYITKNKSTVWNEIAKTHEEYGNVLRTTSSLRAAKDYIKANELKSEEGGPWEGYWVVIKKGDNLDPNVIRKHFETEATSHAAKRQRGDNIAFDSVEGPVTSAILNSHNHGKAIFSALMIKRFKDWFVEAYVKPGDQSPVRIKPNPESPAGKPDLFPLERSQILKETSRLEEWEQAIVLHDQISRMDMGTPNKTLANGIANISMKLSDLIEESVMYSKTYNKNVKKALNVLSNKLRKAQMNNRDIADVGSNVLTFLKITLSPITMLLVQSPAAFGNLITYGQTGIRNLSPVKVVQNYKEMIMLTAVAGKNWWKLKDAENIVWDASLEQMHAKMDATFKVGKPGFFKNYDSMKTLPDYSYILREGQIRDFFTFGNHEMAQTLFSTKIRDLGNRSNSWTLHDASGVLDIANPLTWFNRMTQVSKEGFRIGEMISRFGNFIAAQRNWETLNPGKNWRNKEALDKIFTDADILSGSMHRWARYSFLDTTFGNTFGKFLSYPTKIMLSPFNKGGRIGTAKEAMFNVAAWLSIATPVGMTLYQLMEYQLKQFIDATEGGTPEDKELELLIARYSIADVFLNNLMVGWDKEINPNDYLLISEKFNPFGQGDQGIHPFYATNKNIITNVLFNDDENMGAVMSLIQQLIGKTGTAPMLLDLYWDPTTSTKEKLATSTNLILKYIPFMKNFDEYQKQLLTNDITTKSGQPLGVGGEQTDIWWRTLLGVQTVGQRKIMDMLVEDSDRKKMITDSVRRSLILFNESFGRQPTIHDMKIHKDAWVLMLKNRGFLKTDLEELEWIQTFENQVSRQDVTLMTQLIEKSLDNLIYKKVYKPETATRFFELYDLALKNHPEKAKLLKSRYDLIKKYDQRYYDELKQSQQGTK